MKPHQINRPAWHRNVRDFALIVAAIVVTTAVALVIARDPADKASSDLITSPTPIAKATADVPQARDLIEGIDTLLVIGDGTARVGGLEPGWPGQLATRRGWELTNLARAGTGFNVSPSGEECAVEVCPSFLGSIIPAVEDGLSPDLIIVSGGGWDGLQDMPARRASVAVFFNALRATYRSAGIIALEPMWLDEPLPAPLQPVRNAVREQVMKVGGAYVEVGAPFQNPPNDTDPMGFNDAANLTVVAAIEGYLRELSEGS